MGHKFLNRISRILHYSPKSTEIATVPNEKQLQDDLFNKYDDIKIADKKEKKRWTSTFTTKRRLTIKRNSLAKEWFNHSAIDIQQQDHHIIPFFHHHQEKVEHFNDEKVEIIVSSSSMNSFLSTTTKTSGYQIPSFYYSTPDLPSSPKITEQEEYDITPRTSIDEHVESLEIVKPGIGLSKMVKDVLGDAFSIADQEFFQEH